MDWSWLTLVLLGAYHGVNPAMGWLFAVALGLQERSRQAVLLALPPIAIGHELSLIGVLAFLVPAQMFAAPDTVRLVAAAALVVFGLFRLASRRHPRRAGMRVGAKGLVVWSFLTSTAHGAGLMLLPVLVGLPEFAEAHAPGENSAIDMAAPALLRDGLLALTVHALAMTAVMGSVAVVVYEKLGLALLRSTWVNQDLIWPLVLIAGGLWIVAVA